MEDKDKTKEQLIEELKSLRQQVAKLRILEVERKQMEEELKGLNQSMELRISRRTEDLAKINAELITELTRYMEVEESLARRAHIAEFCADVGTILIRGTVLREILQRCCEAMVKHLDAAFARIWTLNKEENMLELQASAGIYTHLNGPHSRVPVGNLKIGLIAKERKPQLTNNVTDDPRINNKDWARREGMIAFAGHPLIARDKLVGVMAMFARKPLPKYTIDALASVADDIAVGIARKWVTERP